MKSLFLLFLLTYCQFFSAQYYIRTKQNVGIYTNYNFGQSRVLNPSFQLGICTQIGGYMIPEAGVSFVSAGEENVFQSATGAIQFRKRILKINARKRGAKCMGEIIDLFVAPEYFYSPNNKWVTWLL